MHVVIMGCGRVGASLAAALERLGHEVAIIDKNRRAFRRLPDDWAGRAVVGFGFDRDHLAEVRMFGTGVVKLPGRSPTPAARTLTMLPLKTKADLR